MQAGAGDLSYGSTPTPRADNVEAEAAVAQLKDNVQAEAPVAAVADASEGTNSTECAEMGGKEEGLDEIRLEVADSLEKGDSL